MLVTSRGEPRVPNLKMLQLMFAINTVRIFSTLRHINKKRISLWKFYFKDIFYKAYEIKLLNHMTHHISSVKFLPRFETIGLLEVILYFSFPTCTTRFFNVYIAGVITLAIRHFFKVGCPQKH